MAEVQLTEAGRRELEARLEYLKSVRRAEIAEEIKIHFFISALILSGKLAITIARQRI